MNMLRILKRQSRKPVEPPRPMLAPDRYAPDVDPAKIFWDSVKTKPPKRVLEVGTRRTVADRQTHRHSRFPWVDGKDYIKLDIRPGIDVDVIGDLHALPEDWTGKFDCFLADAVFEHLERPWIAAKEVERVLSPGGTFLVSTHQCFPIHGHPSDFFRFSKEALRLIFEDAGLTVDASEYSEQCLIVPPEHIVPYGMLDSWNREFPSYVLVRATGRKG